MHAERRRTALSIVAAPLMAASASPTVRAAAVALTPAQVDWIRRNPVVDFTPLPDLPPMSFFDRGRYAGFAAEMLDRMSERLALEFRPVPVASRREAVERLARGDVHMVPIVGITPSRQALFRFTRPFVSQAFAVYGLDPEPGRPSGRALAVPTGYEHLAASYLPGAPRIAFDHAGQAIELLRDGAASAAVLSVQTLAGWVARHPEPGLRRVAPLRESVPFAMAVRHDLPVLAEVLDAFLASQPSDELDGLRQVWGGEDAADATAAIVAGGAVAAAIAAIAAAGAWRQARRRRRTD